MIGHRFEPRTPHGAAPPCLGALRLVDGGPIRPTRRLIDGGLEGRLALGDDRLPPHRLRLLRLLPRRALRRHACALRRPQPPRLILLGRALLRQGLARRGRAVVTLPRHLGGVVLPQHAHPDHRHRRPPPPRHRMLARRRLRRRLRAQLQRRATQPRQCLANRSRAAASRARDRLRRHAGPMLGP